MSIFLFNVQIIAGGLSLAEEKVNHYLATGSLGRAIPMDSDFPLSDPIDDLEQIPLSSGSHRDRGSYGVSHRDRDYNGHYPRNSSGDHRASSSYHHSTEHSNKIPYVQGSDINSHPERDKMVSANNGKTSGKDQGKDKEVCHRVLNV